MFRILAKAKRPRAEFARNRYPKLYPVPNIYRISNTYSLSDYDPLRPFKGLPQTHSQEAFRSRRVSASASPSTGDSHPASSAGSQQCISADMHCAGP